MRLFVYGTLKHGHNAHVRLSQYRSKLIGEVKSHPRYRLYDVGGFPGMVPGDEREEGGVHGEVYDITERALPGLDQYEAVAYGLFRREEIELADGTKALAYLFNKPLDGLEEIETGVWN